MNLIIIHSIQSSTNFHISFQESETARTYIKPPGNKDVSLIQDLHLHRLDNLPPQRTLMCPIPPISSPKSAYSVSPTAEYYYHGSSFQHPAAAPPAAHSGLPYQAGSGGTARDQPKQKDTLTGSFTSQCTNKSRFTWHNCMPNLKTSPKNRRDSNSRKQQLSSSSSSSSSSGNSSNRSSNNNFNNNNGSSVNKSTGSACCQVSGHKLQSGSGSTRGKNSVNKAVLCCGDISCEDLHKVSTLVSPSSPPPADFNLLDKRGYPNLELAGAPNPSLLHLPGPTSVTDVEVLRCNPSSHGVQNSFSSPPKALPQAMGDRHQDLQCQQQHYQPVHFTQPEYQAVDDRPLSPAASPVPSSPDYHQYSSSYDRSHQYRQSPHQHHHHDNLTSSLSSSPPPSPQSASPHVPLPPSPTLPHQLSSPREGSFQSNKESYSPSPSGTEQDPYTSPSYREVLPSSASPPAVITLESNTHHNAMYQKQQQRHHHTLQYEESQHQLQRQQQQQHRPIKNLSLRESCYESEVIWPLGGFLSLSKIFATVSWSERLYMLAISLI